MYFETLKLGRDGSEERPTTAIVFDSFKMRSIVSWLLISNSITPGADLTGVTF
jgi:hypothetical protein